MIKDSGQRREFATGAVRDIQEGKGRCDLLPLDVVVDIIAKPVLEGINRFTKTGNPQALENALVIFANEVFGGVPNMLLEAAIHFEEGAAKYGENNWQKGLPASCYVDSAVRHYLKYLRGDTDERHDRAFAWNLMCCAWTCYYKPEMNTYGTKEGPENDR